jgi:hypothetical protein
MINLIIDILKADANITAITTTSRIYPVSRLEGGVIPAIVVQLTNTDPADTHDNTTNMDVHTVQVSVIEDRPKEAHALAELCRSALDGYTGGTIAECRFINQATDVFESIDLYTQTMLFRVMLVRDNVTLPTALADLGIFELDDVSDVNAPNPTDGQALIYDDATSTWIPGDVSATLAALTDVNLDEPLDREALVYDEATTSWINGGPAKVDIPVFNNTFNTITKGQVIQFGNSAQGDRMGITLFSATSINDPKALVGIASENIPAGEPGHVRSYGTIYGINTNAYPVGTILYASVTDGQLTSTAPTAPNHRIAIAVVTRQHQNTGRIFVRTYTPAFRLADLSNVASTSPTTGQALSWDGSKWAPANVGYIPGSPPPGGFLGNVFYQDNAGNFTQEDAFRYTASTNTLAVENITGTTVTGSGVVKGSNTFGQRYATQAATNRALANTASITVERYFTVTAEGNGESFNIQTNTPSAGNKIVRKIWYKDEAFEATDVDTWTLLHTFADDTTYANTATKWQEYLDGQANGTPPFTLAISWEDVTIPVGILDGYTTDLSGAFATALLNENYTGNCLKVRRASDNTEQDIGFDGADLDTAALTTFCTGTDCFVRTWYDQSGNANNLTQTTTGNQPKIYDASTGVLQLGSAGFEKPALLVNSKWFDWTTPVSFTNLTFFTVTKKASTAGTGSVIFYQNSGAYGGDDVDNQGNPRLGTTSGVIIGNSLSNTTTSGAENTHHISYYHRNGTSADGGLNGEVKTPASPVNTTAFTVNDIFNYGSTYTYDGQAQAIIMYNASKSADRAAIESALNDYFNVY